MKSVGAALVLLVAVSPSVAAQRATQSPPPAPAPARTAESDVDLLSRAGESRTFGPDSAKVVLLEFVDFQCSVCAAFHAQRADSLKRAVGADVRIVYVNFPLSIHLRSQHSSEAAMCAAGIGGTAGFNGMADRLFRQQSAWSTAFDPAPVFARFAREAGLDAAAFADCVSRDVPSALILSDLSTAGKFGINGTPTFVVIRADAKSAEEAAATSGNVPIANILDLINKARAKAP